jgi:hypothetical protein
MNLSFPPSPSPSYLEEVVGGDHFLDENHVDRGVALLVRHHALQLVHHVLGRLVLLKERREGGREGGREGESLDRLFSQKWRKKGEEAKQGKTRVSVRPDTSHRDCPTCYLPLLHLFLPALPAFLVCIP